MLNTAGKVAGAKLGPGVLHSTLGRHAARAIRAAVIAETALKHWGLLVNNIGSGDTTSFTPWDYPAGEQQGFGFHEAPRGTLSHWVVIENGKIKNYQCVVPSTWNAGPRDDKDRMGPYEASLVGNPIADPERPLEVFVRFTPSTRVSRVRFTPWIPTVRRFPRYERCSLSLHPTQNARPPAGRSFQCMLHERAGRKASWPVPCGKDIDEQYRVLSQISKHRYAFWASATS